MSRRARLGLRVCKHARDCPVERTRPEAEALPDILQEQVAFHFPLERDLCKSARRLR